MKLQVNLNMMRRCSLLFEFLFCINHLARLNAVSVHNWSSKFNNNPSKNWVVLVAGTNTWRNYRHQADVFHAYQIVRKNNVPAENIITFAYDDIANKPRNPFKGKVFHDYLYEDIYQGVEIDYRGKDVTRDNFVKVLKGDEKLAANKKKVLKRISLPIICFTILRIFDGDLYDPLSAVYVTTSAKETEQSWSIFCDDTDIDVCLASEYAYAWIGDSEYVSISKKPLQISP
ncbi:hypothetical protein T265_15580, partial [Opisthorchis viverrini]